MKFIENTSTDAYYNLAFEEYIFKNLKEDVVLLWRNAPAIIVGKHQNTVEEINTEFVKAQGIKIVRRITGGGAVYHDLGNLNFSFITNSENTAEIDFKTHNIPILNALKQLGVNCELSGRNDMVIEGKKFSGIAQSVARGRVLNHGTILFDSDLGVLSQALKVKQDKIESKGIKSVASRVTNIREHLTQDVDVLKFKEVLLENIFEFLGKPVTVHELSDADRAAIDGMVRERYSTWEWNYGQSPKFNVKGYQRFPGGGIEVRLMVKEGIIEESKIYGDFFGARDPEELENRLVGLKYDQEAIAEGLKAVKVEDYLGRITREEFMTCIFS
ncbi:MAG: lipoate--protein ligase [delta proteobacterium ML8_F1]|nr:MAG: lipoate--protein ligase [delta proteobacterium ML8_F1]